MKQIAKLMGTVAIPEKALGKVIKFVEKEIEGLRSELAVVNKK